MSAAVHIKLDTGMNRVGYSWECPDAIVGEVRSIVALQGIVVQGVYSHLATSDADAGFAKLQYSRFCSVLEQLKHAGLHIPIKHISNSGGVLNHPEFNLDMVRCGVLTYGLAPCSTPEGAARLRALGVMPVLTLRSRIAQVKNVRFGESVGYSRNFQATRDIVVATVPIGYADGVSRRLSNKGVVLVKGRFCHIIGNVCMDQLMVDVTGVEAKLRDGVTFIGVDGEQAIYAEDVARLQGSINYEVATSVSHRISICHV
jgi:alanine racemase